MRQTIAGFLSVLIFTLGMPVPGSAQGGASTTSALRGQVVSASGLGASDMRIELVSDGTVVSTTISTVDGHFNFPAIPAGTYIVRTTANGVMTGVRVSVIAGQANSGALIVMPSVAKTTPRLVAMFASGFLASALSGIAIVTTVGMQNIVQIKAREEDRALVDDAITQAKANLLLQILGVNGTNFQFIPTKPASASQ